MACVYILFSAAVRRHYIGSCMDLELRIKEHQEGSYKNAFTARARDWILIHQIDNLEFQQARKIELHIKGMKSTKFIQNLIAYPELNQKLIQRYCTGSFR